MANLRRHVAPIDNQAWNFIDEEARRILNTKLTARRVVNFVGPKGIDFAAVNTGRRVALTDSAVDGVDYNQRHVLPLVEVEVPFRLPIEEIDSLVRGAEDVETDSLIEAAEKVAQAENEAIFNGIAGTEIEEILSVSEQPPVQVDEDIVSSVATGVKQLVSEGIAGPYSLLLGPELYALLYEPNEKGYPAKRRIENLLDGKLIAAPSLEDKGLLLPHNSEDFELIVGQDISIGFCQQDGDELEFFMTESLAFRVNAPEAAVVLE